MKVSAVLLCLVLAAASVSSQVLESHTPMACCVATTKRKLPFQRLESYQRISNSFCLQEAVIFKTKLGREICADPREKWVKNFMKLLDQKSQALKPSEPSYMH